jgi:hypothetical protein
MPRITSISHLSQEATKVKIIRDAIRAEDKRLRSQYFLLREEWQDAVGAAIFLTAAFTWALLSYSWYMGALSTPLLIIGNALAISLLHEMEHDLIHDLYFKKNKAVQNAMFAFIWVIKRYVISTALPPSLQSTLLVVVPPLRVMVVARYGRHHFLSSPSIPSSLHGKRYRDSH